MEKQAKKILHITWEEAHRTETERDKARQTSCRPMPPSRIQVIIGYVSGDLRKLKTSVSHLTCNHTLWPSRCKGKSLVSAAAVEGIAVYSKGLLRTICDNALLIAYSASKKQGFSVKMLKKEKLDYGFEPRVPSTEDVAGVLENRRETEAAKAQRAQFGGRIVGSEEEPLGSYLKRGPTKSAIALFAGIILLLCVGTVSYLQRSKNHLSHLAVNQGAIAQQGSQHSSNLKPMVDGSKTQLVGPQVSSINYEPAQPEDQESTANRARADLGNFKVLDDSFVRDKPEPNATVIATLRPGTQVRVEGKTQEYLRIRSLSDAEIIGYVHEEDAFFQAIK